MLFQGWTVISNKQTADYPIPVPNGDPTWLIDDTDPNWTPLSPNGTAVTVSHTYAFDVSGFIDGERIQIPDTGEDIWYRVDYTDLSDPEYPIVEVGEYFQVDAPGWIIRQIPPRLVPPGTTIKVSLVHENRSATDTVTADYNYTSENQDVVVADGQAHRRLNRTYVQFSKVDAGGSNTLDAVTVGGHIRVAGVSDWTISSITDGGSYWEYEITGTGNPADGLHSFEFEYITGLVPQYYIENVGYWTAHPPSSGSVTGELIVSGVVTGDADTAYGIDLLLSPADVSQDWSLVSTMDGATGTERTTTSGALTPMQANWVEKSAEPVIQGQVTTTQGGWVTVLDLAFLKSSHGALTVTGKREGGAGEYVARCFFLASKGEPFDIQLDQISRLSTISGNHVRAESDANGIRIEVKGVNRQEWTWQALLFARTL